MMRIAVIGAGSHSSSNHGPALQRCRAEWPDRVELVAVCDLDAGRARAYAERFGFGRVYTDIEQMVAQERPDGIVAVTPVEATAELAAQVARLGVPLVIEKPPARSPEGVRRLRDAVAATGTPHMVSLNRRFSPALQRARAWLRDQQAPGLAVSRMLRQARREDRFAYDTGIHAVDTVVCCMGEPIHVSAVRHPIGAHSTAMFAARFGFAEQGAALLCMAPASGAVEETLELLGDDYDVQVDLGNCAVHIRQNDRPVLDWEAPPGTPMWEANGALDETRAFVIALETGTGWWPELREAAWSSAAAAAMQAGHDGPLARG